jgi:hypothetical protein
MKKPPNGQGKINKGSIEKNGKISTYNKMPGFQCEYKFLEGEFMQIGDTSYTDSAELKTIRKYCGIKGLYLFNIIEQLLNKGEKQEILLREFDVKKFTKNKNKSSEGLSTLL